jgi:hypothetical protein
VVVPPHAAARHLHVRVRVDAARDHVLARGVDDRVGLDRTERVRAGRDERSDRFAIDEHVLQRRSCGRDNRPALDEDCAHGAVTFS